MKNKQKFTFPWLVVTVFSVTIAAIYHGKTDDEIALAYVFFVAIVASVGMWAMDTRNFYYSEYLKSRDQVD